MSHSQPPKTYLAKVRLNSQGYTDSGEYFGAGPPTLYCYQLPESEGDGYRHYIRATSRKEAKSIVLQRHPAAKFYI